MNYLFPLFIYLSWVSYATAYFVRTRGLYFSKLGFLLLIISVFFWRPGDLQVLLIWPYSLAIFLLIIFSIIRGFSARILLLLSSFTIEAGSIIYYFSKTIF